MSILSSSQRALTAPLSSLVAVGAVTATLLAERDALAQTPTEGQSTGAGQAHAASPHPAHAPESAGSAESARAVYLSGDIGFARSDLGLAGDLDFDRTAANGLVYALSAGVRLREVRLGLRWRVHDTTEFTLWNFAVSAGVGLPLRPISPVFSAHLGYVFDQRVEAPLFRSALPEGTILPPNIDLKGAVVGLDVEASYWATSFLRIGPFIGADAMLLRRARADVPPSLFGASSEVLANPLYTESAGSFGLNLNAGLRGAFDIGL